MRDSLSFLGYNFHNILACRREMLYGKTEKGTISALFG